MKNNFERLSNGVVLIDGKHYRCMTDEECADYIWGNATVEGAKSMGADRPSSRKVFLGGTCNSEWREELKPLLHIDYFDPVVDDWDEVAYQRELQERAVADYVLYVITPKMTGVYAIGEVVDDSNKRPGKTLFCYLEADGKAIFTEGQLRSLRNIERMVEDNGGKVFGGLVDVASYLNTLT